MGVHFDKILVDIKRTRDKSHVSLAVLEVRFKVLHGFIKAHFVWREGHAEGTF